MGVRPHAAAAAPTVCAISELRSLQSRSTAFGRYESMPTTARCSSRPASRESFDMASCPSATERWLYLPESSPCESTPQGRQPMPRSAHIGSRSRSAVRSTSEYLRHTREMGPWETEREREGRRAVRQQWFERPLSEYWVERPMTSVLHCRDSNPVAGGPRALVE